MTKQERYEIYKENYLKKHKTKHGLYSYEAWSNKIKYKSKGFNKYALFACDFETTKQKEFTDEEIYFESITNEELDLYKTDRYSKVFLSGIWDIRTNEYRLCYENIADTFDAVVEMTAKQHKAFAIMYFHNLSFDGSFILRWLIDKGWKQTLRTNPKSKQPMIRYHEYATLISGGKYFSIQLRWKGIRIYIFDSLKILPSSLASLGETVGYKKLQETVDYSKFQIDKNHNYPKEWLIYLKRDCKILAQILKDFYEHEPNAQSITTMTIGSISFKHIKSQVNYAVPKQTIADFYDWVKWYHGGLTFPSLKWQGKWMFAPHKIKFIDATSMYPSMMIKPLPCGEPTKHIDKSWESHTTYYEIKIIKARIKPQYNDIAIIPKPYIWKDRKKQIKILFDGEIVKTPYEYVQSVDNEIYHVIKEELELWEKIYDIKYKILNKWHFETIPYLKEEVEKLFLDKQEASRKKQKTTKLICKLKINSLYGKLCQKPNRAQDFYGELKDIDTTKFKVLGKKHLDIEAYNVEQIKEDKAIAKPVFVGAYITALARVSLISKYKYIVDNGGTFLYSDTDSICYKDARKEIKFNDIGDNLGQWAFEEDKDTGGVLIGDGFISLCPKQYRVVKMGKDKPMKFACAGVNKEVMELVKNQDYNLELDDNKSYKLTKRKLTNSRYGKIIDENGQFTFKKWKPYFPNIKCPKKLWN